MRNITSVKASPTPIDYHEKQILKENLDISKALSKDGLKFRAPIIKERDPNDVVGKNIDALKEQEALDRAQQGSIPDKNPTASQSKEASGAGSTMKSTDGEPRVGAEGKFTNDVHKGTEKSIIDKKAVEDYNKQVDEVKQKYKQVQNSSEKDKFAYFVEKAPYYDEKQKAYILQRYSPKTREELETQGFRGDDLDEEMIRRHDFASERIANFDSMAEEYMRKEIAAIEKPKATSLSGNNEVETDLATGASKDEVPEAQAGDGDSELEVLKKQLAQLQKQVGIDLTNTANTVKVEATEEETPSIVLQPEQVKNPYTRRSREMAEWKKEHEEQQQRQIEANRKYREDEMNRNKYLASGVSSFGKISAVNGVPIEKIEETT